ACGERFAHRAAGHPKNIGGPLIRISSDILCGMTRWMLVGALSAVFLTGAGRFDTKLSKDQQVIHALNRLTFGQRPGDLDEVRRVGVEKWIDLQLHPERMAESPLLDARLKPLETLRMDVATLIKEYPLASPAFAPMRFTPINEL